MNLKVGDRVEAICKVDGLDITGLKGTVHTIDDDETLNIGVEFDDEFKKGHDLHGDLNNNKGRYGNENDFTLIKENKMLNKKLPTPVLQDYVNVLDTFFSERRIFTKYDVTKQLRHNGFMAAHRHVRNILNTELVVPDDYGIYDLTIPGDPQVYCPDEKDVSEYDANGVPEFNVHNAPAKAKPQAPKKTTTITAQKKGKSFGLFDVRNRYSVKAAQTRKAGFSPGVTLRICVLNDSISVVEERFGRTGDRKATVDCYCNIRVPKEDFVIPCNKGLEVAGTTSRN